MLLKFNIRERFTTLIIIYLLKIISFDLTFSRSPTGPNQKNAEKKSDFSVSRIYSWNICQRLTLYMMPISKWRDILKNIQNEYRVTNYGRLFFWKKRYEIFNNLDVCSRLRRPHISSFRVDDAPVTSPGLLPYKSWLDKSNFQSRNARSEPDNPAQRSRNVFPIYL